MRRIMQTRSMALCVVCSFIACGPSVARTANTESRAASALYREFETVLYSKSQLLSDPGRLDHLSKLEASNLRYPFSYLEIALDSLPSQSSTSVLANSGSVLLGAKDFLSPKGLGPVRSQRCYVVVLAKRGTPDFRKMFSYSPVAHAAGAPVWNWAAKIGEFGEGDTRPSSIYGAVIANSYLLVCNNLTELQSLADRLVSSTDESARSLSRIRDWDEVSRHDFWCYRRYRHTGISDRSAAGMDEVTPSAEALIFFLDSDKMGVLQLDASDSTTATRINASMAKTNISWPPLRPSASAIWTTAITFSGDERSADRIFIVMGLFGFAVYL